MKLTTEKYTIEYKDSYENGKATVEWFQVKINDSLFNIDYSENLEKIVMTSAEECGENVEADNKLLDYLDYELKTVCKFMLDIM